MARDISRSAIDLFCGCGGLAAGARSAGYAVIAGVDLEPKFMATFSHNFPEAASVAADVSSLEPHELARSLKIQRGELGLLVGGPPCQGFSKNVPRRSRFMEDERNRLVLRFLEYCDYLRPKVVLMENVAEMKNGFDQAYSDEVIDALTRLGYEVTHAVLNAADFGVPQRRRRAFFIGVHGRSAIALPRPTHTQPALPDDLFSSPKHVAVWAAIGDLPSLVHGEGFDVLRYPTEPVGEYQTWARGESSVVRNHVSRKLQPLQYERLAALLPGQGLKDLPAKLRTRGGYSGAYGRLTKEMIAPTITRWVFHPGSGRWGHPVDIRTLSIREVARIQSFPDDFTFVGTYIQQAGQLGNAVPPLLATKILQSIDRQLGSVRFEQLNQVLHRHAVNH
jgi:DNA (cytosine-5)-methyltransferase 1